MARGMIEVILWRDGKQVRTWTVAVGRGSVTRFHVDGCEHTGIVQVFVWIANQIARIL